MNISTRRRHMWAGLGTIVAMLLAACGGEDPRPGCEALCKPHESYIPFAGTWRGTLVEATSGSFGEVDLTLQQSGATLSGNWSARFNSGTVNGGTITGAVLGNDSTADFRLTSTGGCPMSVTVSVLDGKAQGTYASVSCPVLLAGSVHVYQDGGPMPYNPPLPAQPTGVVATAGNGQVTLRWSRVAGASSHNVYWSTSPGVTPHSGTRELQVKEPATIKGLQSGIPYYFTVTAANATGEGPASAAASATPLVSAPNAPTSIVAVSAPGQATVTWPAVAGATGYNLYWSTAPGQAFSSGTRVPNVTNGFVLSGLANGTTHFITVTAVNDAGESAPSVEARATPYETLTYSFDNVSLQDWIPSGSWALNSSKAHSGTYSVTDSPGGSYANNTGSWLQSPVISLSGSAVPMLTFWHQYALEPGYDWGRVEISTNYGASWTVLKSFTGTQTAWTAETISLHAYAGSSVLIRFRLTSDTSAVADGWYLDDVVISR